jgi:hypothetical protein
MPRVADYRTIVDTSFVLNEQHIESFSFSMLSGFHSASRSILFFQLRKPEGATLELRVHVNNSQEPIWTGTFTGESEIHSVHETINPNVLQQDGNELTFFSSGGNIDSSNPVRIGDVFILCQVDI